MYLFESNVIFVSPVFGYQLGPAEKLVYSNLVKVKNSLSFVKQNEYIDDLPIANQGFWQPSMYPFFLFSKAFPDDWGIHISSFVVSWKNLSMDYSSSLKPSWWKQKLLGIPPTDGKKKSTEARFCWERVTTVPRWWEASCCLLRTYSADQVKLNCYQPLDGWTTHVTNYAQVQVNLDRVSDVGIRGRHNQKCLKHPPWPASTVKGGAN